LSEVLRTGEGAPAGQDVTLVPGLRATRLGKGAVPRETPTVFAALIGWLVPGEKVGPLWAGLRALSAIGAVNMEWTR